MIISTKKDLSAIALAAMLAEGGVAYAQTTNTLGGSSTMDTTVSNTSTTSSSGSGIYMPTSATTSGSGTVTPGVPNTGAGGDMTTNILLLGTSGLVLLAGATYLLRKGIPA